jgi:flagellar basal-body rod modification protein FlgD
MSILSPLSSASLNAASTTSASSAAATSSSGTSANLQSLDFMKLLVAQMQNQNPMDPQSATDFTTQVAQLSQVQGITQLNQTIASMVTMQNLAQSTNLIGMKVTYTNGAGGTSNGVVGSVAVTNGKAQLIVNGAQVDLSQIKTVEAGPQSTTSA